MRYVIRCLLSLLMVVFAAWCVVQLRADLSVASLIAAVRSWNLVLAALVMSMLNYLLRTVRWRWYLARLGHELPFGFCWLTYSAGFAFTLSPGKVGEVARARYYTALGIPLGEVTAAFCVERLLDLLAVVALAMCLVSLFPRYSALIWLSAAGVTLALLLLLALARAGPWLPVARRCSRLATAARGVLRAAGPLLTPQGLLVGAGLGLAAWGCEALGLGFLAYMFPEAHLTWQTAVGIYAVAILAGAVALLPGGLGGTEAVMTTLLVSQGLGLTAAVLLTLICRLVTLWFAVALGWIAILVLRLRRPALGVLL
jgi:uncharacterized membrane protein YbhN (UPF0104 family)